MKKKRLDELLIEKGWAEDRTRALITIVEGRVFVHGQKMISPAQGVDPDAPIEMKREPEYVGRGALKLEAAIQKFHIALKHKICADLGSATGGFVEVLVRRGAKKVYAIDVARGKLALKFRRDPRVVVMEGIDVRNLDRLSEMIDVLTIDISLITLRQILPTASRFLKPNGTLITLFKPQYETRDQNILKHGVVRDSNAREKLLRDFMKWAEQQGWEVEGWIESPIRGSSGNVEYLVHLRKKV